LAALTLQRDTDQLDSGESVVVAERRDLAGVQCAARRERREDSAPRLTPEANQIPPAADGRNVGKAIVDSRQSVLPLSASSSIGFSGCPKATGVTRD
jgi:hypothetical protein